jgi:STE24 endopeptidase
MGNPRSRRAAWPGRLGLGWLGWGGWLRLALGLAVAAAPAAAGSGPAATSPAATSPAAPIAPSAAAAPAAAPTPGSAGSAGRFDPVAAADAYLARLTPAQRARSDAYFEGGYWLLLWDFLYGAGIALLLLSTGLSARLRDLAERWFAWRPVQTFCYAALYVVAVAVLGFPLACYEGFVREHQYGLSTQSFGAWATDQAKGLAVGVVLGGVMIAVLYGVLRRAPRTWWIWGAVVSVLLFALVMLLQPVFIDPLFNRYTELRDPVLRGRILSLARANGVPADHVYMVDASRQSTRVSANVAGLLGTTRIALNDNLLRRCSLPEIEAVMGHEMGHYVLHHMWIGLLFLGVLAVVAFAFVKLSFGRVVARWGAGWRVSGIDDPAGLPLLGLLLSLFLFVMTPVLNTFVRTLEAEADIFGLNAARQPDGEAEVALKLAEYRKLAPGPIEEWIFFDHPSGRSRILMAMRWKAEQPKEPPCRSGAVAVKVPALPQGGVGGGMARSGGVGSPP